MILFYFYDIIIYKRGFIIKAKIINSFSGEFNGKATLHYKNNTEITEYDILKIGNNDNCLVVFTKGCFFVLIEDKAVPLYSIEECEVLYNQKQKEVQNCTKMKKQK